MHIDWIAVFSDFTDLPDFSEALHVSLRMLGAVLLGGAIGFERQLKGKAAGLRTHMLVSLGAALFVVPPERAGMSIGDLSRVIQGVVTGIGFLGAGAIVKMSVAAHIKGLTTAASIWLATAIGITAGLGRMSTALMATVLALVVLAVLGKIEVWGGLERRSEERRE